MTLRYCLWIIRCRNPLSISVRKMAEKRSRDAGVIIIGDEILKGHTKDLNASFLLSRLWSNGVTVKKVSFISDCVNIISKEVKEFSSAYSLVITCGGIGPTHDDLTFEGVAKAFDKPLVVNKELKDKIRVLSPSKSLSPALLKMATIPDTTKLITGIDPVTNTYVKYPLMNVNNVYIFPGVPEYMHKSFVVNEHLFSTQNKFLLMKIYISVYEDVVASTIEAIDKKHPGVNIGSYPVLNDVYKVKLTLESDNEVNLENAYTDMMEKLPSEFIVSVKKCLPNSRDKHHEALFTSIKPATKERSLSHSHLKSLSLVDLEHYLSSSDTSSLGSALKCSWSVFHQAAQTYSLDELCIGFNGGKDCTAIMHLYVSYIKKYFPDHSKILGLYLKNNDPFIEAQDFILNCEFNYDMEMIIISAGIKEGLEKLKESHPNIKAIIMGTRRHDPYSLTLRSFTMTDESWPKYMRIFPILDWSYCEVWEFLRTFDLPYCHLYDEGYTSLGDATNTKKNPCLLKKSGQYLPAYCLKDENQEREGRIEKTTK